MLLMLLLMTGGWMCFDAVSCQSRWLNTPHLMSSTSWPPVRRGNQQFNNNNNNTVIYNTLNSPKLQMRSQQSVWKRNFL